MIVLLTALFICDIGFVTLPNDSREFGHWACPVITSQTGYEITSYVLDVSHAHKTGFEKRLLSTLGGCVFSIALWKILNIERHYVTPREHHLCNSGIGLWGTCQMGVNLLRLFTNSRHDKVLIPTPVRIRTTRLREIPREEKK